MADRLAGRIKKTNTDNNTYFEGWPGKCNYNADLNWASNIAIQYLEKIAPMYRTKKGLVVFDLDETLFMGDPDESLEMSEMSFKYKDEEIFILPLNRQVCRIATKAKELKFQVVCITARPPESEMASIVNLNMYNIPCDTLIMNKENTDPCFKINERRKLQIPGKQEIVLTIGDQGTDIYLPGPNSAVIKLPEPDLKCAYAYIP